MQYDFYSLNVDKRPRSHSPTDAKMTVSTPKSSSMKPATKIEQKKNKKTDKVLEKDVVQKAHKKKNKNQSEPPANPEKKRKIEKKSM